MTIGKKVTGSIAGDVVGFTGESYTVVFKANGAFDEKLTTGRGGWKVGRVEGMRPAGRDAGAWGAGDQFEITGCGPYSGEPEEWLKPETVRLLKQLDPYPGRQYDFRRVEFVVPDIRVDEEGTVEVDQRDVPELRVSPKYIEMAKDRSLDEETRRFAAERVRKAREFREAVIRRQDTMERVAELAIGGQEAYLREGPAALRRQTMSAVARAAKCNVATVSRAAARKYVKTPRGTVPLRKFFALVDQAPIEKLREILAEGRGRLTDREVSDRMAKAGFKMARRTVAKYRARLGAT